MERGVTQVVRNVLQGGGTNGTNFCLGGLDVFGVNGEEARGHTHGFSDIDPGDTSATDSSYDMGDAQGGSSAGSGGNSVEYYLHRYTTCNRGIVDGVAADI